MISSLSIHNYKSFHPTEPIEIRLNTQKRTALFFGLNGAGKSAIGEVIHLKDRQDPSVNHCRLIPTGTGPFRYLVYNHAFLLRVLGGPAGMPGIFTLGEPDKAALEEAEAKEAEINTLDANRQSIEGQIALADRQTEQLLTTAREAVWKSSYTKHIDGALGQFLKGWGRNKLGFFDHLRAIQVPAGTSPDPIAKLEERWADVASEAPRKDKLNLSVSELSLIETDPIWGESIVGSSDSRLAALIEKLGNGDWVGKGRPFTNGDECPFCQQQLPHDFKEELSKLLDGEYQSQVEKLESLVERYGRSIEALDETIARFSTEPLFVEHANAGRAWVQCKRVLDLNLSRMRAKLDSPKSLAVITSTVSDLDLLGEQLAVINGRVDAFNERIAHRREEQDRIKAEFWQRLRVDCAETFSSYATNQAPIDESLKALRAADADAADAIRTLRVRLGELKQRNIGTEQAVAAINARLSHMGVLNFSIVKKTGEENLYRLARPGQPDGSTETLSEGEKTLISFLYYMELLKGSDAAEIEIPIERTVAIIDDPISSLSHNFVYDIASIIYKELIAPAEGKPKPRQIVLLTHNLFFFHEMLKQLGGRLESMHDKCELFRVVKHDHSKVVAMKATDMLNDYDALWQVLKDARDDKVNALVVPNTMRCILEHFFWFTGREKEFTAALEKLCDEGDSGRFRALARYLDRGSHRGHINPLDYGQYDIGYFLSKLRAVFKEAGFEKHYLDQMGEHPNA